VCRGCRYCSRYAGWNKSPGSDIAGYRIHYGTSSGNHEFNEAVDFPANGIYQLEVTARGDLAQDVGPEMHLIIDGETKGTHLVNTDKAQIFVFDIQVSAGVHNLAIGFSNDFYDPAQGLDRNLYIDDISILLSPDDVPPEVDDPQDDVPPEVDDPQKVIEIEAESGRLNYPFEYAWDAEASSDGFVWVPNGRGNSWSPSQNSGYVEINFQAPTAGVYFVWCRVLARNKRDNSFFVSIDDSAYALWDVTKSKSWVWDQVSDRGGADPASIQLDAGAHSLIIMNREDGTKLDKVVITDDSAYIPE
jgi:hypothetical protein